MPDFFATKLSQASSYIKEVVPQTADEAYQAAAKCGSHLWSATQTAGDAIAKVPDLIYNHFNPQNESSDWYNTFSSYAKEGVDQAKYLNCQATEFLKNSTAEKCPNPAATFTAAELLIPGTVVLLSGKFALDNALGAISKMKTLLLERRKEVHTAKLLLGITLNTALAGAWSFIGASVGLGMHNKLNQEGVSNDYQLAGAGVMAAILTVPQLAGLIKNSRKSKPQAEVRRQPRPEQKAPNKEKTRTPPKVSASKQNETTKGAEKTKSKETETPNLNGASKAEHGASVSASPSIIVSQDRSEKKTPGSPPNAKKIMHRDLGEKEEKINANPLSPLSSEEEDAFPGTPSPSTISYKEKNKKGTAPRQESVPPPPTEKQITNGVAGKRDWYNEGVTKGAYPRQGWKPTLAPTVEETDVAQKKILEKHQKRQLEAKQKKDKEKIRTGRKQPVGISGVNGQRTTSFELPNNIKTGRNERVSSKHNSL